MMIIIIIITNNINNSNNIFPVFNLGSLMANQNFVHEQIKFQLKSGNPWYYIAQTLFSSRFLCKNLIFKIYKIIIRPVVL